MPEETKKKKLSPSDKRRQEVRKAKFKKSVFLLTDLCMWEKNKQDGKSAPHAIQVVDVETGQVRFIKSGSKISFVEGEISDVADQELYNKQS